jgi:hypothetical protein
VTGAVNYADFKPKHPRWVEQFPAPDMNEESVSLGFYQRKGEHAPLRAMLSVDLYDRSEDPLAGHWLHISVSRPNRLPSWSDLVLVREEFGYGDQMFIQLIPPVSAWMNLHSYCLHMLHRLDGLTVPDILWKGRGDGQNYRRAGVLTGRRVT